MGTGAIEPGDGTADGAGAQPAPGAGGQPAAVGAPGQPGTVDAGAGGGGEGTGQADGLATYKAGLDPILQNMEPEQLNDMFNTMATAVRTAGSAMQAPPEPVVEPPPPAKSVEEINEMFQAGSETFDPEGAVDAIVKKNYGPLIGSIGQNAAAGMFAAFEKVAPDIDEFRPAIEEALRGVPQVQWNQGLLAQQYFQQKGIKTLRLEREAAAKAQGASTLTPSPETVETEATRIRDEMPDSEKEVAKSMFPNEADPVGKYIERLNQYENTTRTVNVPIGGGKKA